MLGHPGHGISRSQFDEAPDGVGREVEGGDGQPCGHPLMAMPLDGPHHRLAAGECGAREVEERILSGDLRTDPDPDRRDRLLAVEFDEVETVDVAGAHHAHRADRHHGPLAGTAEELTT